MKKIDGFLITILILISLLTGVYYFAYFSLNYFENNEVLKTKYERKKNLNNLARKLQKLDARGRFAAANRSPAAIQAELPVQVTTDARLLAREYFSRAKIKCYELQSELECLQTIEQAVTQYPESAWTGQTLVLLTDFYYRTKRLTQAREILRILKQDFRNDKAIQEKVLIIERHLI